uniref:C2H2-type domain-containing protein n=1 Tax=Meloidogyne floridensis TaxID=298350 RepID=A0A915NKQ5_9BILA
MFNFTSFSTKIEQNVQSRYQRLHVPLKDVEWNVCEYCGEIVHRMVFERHLILHEMADVTYQLYHHEIDVEKKRVEQVKRIQAKETKEKRRNLDNSGFETESSSSTTTTNSLIYPDNINFNKNEESVKEKRKSPMMLDWVMEELINEKERKRQKKMKLTEDEFG